ncbi:MAG: VWA domain-containing protein [Acidobacteriota bacterium]
MTTSLGLSFADPWLLALLALLPYLAWRRHRARAYGALTYSSTPVGSGGLWRLHLGFYLRLLALGCLIVAAARPQHGYALEQHLTEGVDNQIVLDISGSMAAEDFQPRNRLTVAKDVMQEFVDKRRGDRVGIVVFAGQALTKAPLTTDHDMLRVLLDSIELGALPDGTAIGMALASAAARLRDSVASSKVVVLVTDGVNNRGAIDPDSAAAVCEGLGVKVYTIGVGTDGVVPVPVQTRNAFGRIVTQRHNMEVKVDEELLRSIAERTGGRFFQAIDPASLRQIFEEIDQLEKTEIEVKRYIRHDEAFQPLVWAGLLLLLVPALPALVGLTVEP